MPRALRAGRATAAPEESRPRKILAFIFSTFQDVVEKKEEREKLKVLEIHLSNEDNPTYI